MSTAAAMATDIHELSNRQAMFIGYVNAELLIRHYFLQE